jgi:hypothetical protein
VFDLRLGHNRLEESSHSLHGADRVAADIEEGGSMEARKVLPCFQPT